jgi:hypothetical protein
MQWAKVVAVITGIALLLSTTSLSETFAQVKLTPAAKMPVALSLEMEGCNNDLTCGAEFLVGDTINFSGVLTADDGTPIPNAEIRIVQFLPKPELVTIASGVTGIDGEYNLSWMAQLPPKEEATTDVTEKILKDNVVFFAQFDGDDTYSSARTAKLTAIVQANQIFTSVNAEKRVYGPGESALLFIGFIDTNDEFVDPDSIRVLYDDQELKVEQKKTGSYTVVTPTLTVDHHQLLVIPKKEGYNAENGFLTVQVSGFFGKA